jgi:PilZ domain
LLTQRQEIARPGQQPISDLESKRANATFPPIADLVVSISTQFRVTHSGVSSDTGPEKPRGAPRLGFAAEVGVRRTGVRSFRVRIFDASPEGCKIEFVERPAIGERVWVKFDNLEALEGTVRWVDGHTGGVQFEHPLHEAVFERLAAASKNEQ